MISPENPSVELADESATVLDESKQKTVLVVGQI